MATTPEGRVKKVVKKVLDSYGQDLFYDMPVPCGYGRSTLDFVGCYRGRAFAIETKAPGREPTERQWDVILKMRKAGYTVFVIDNKTSTRERDWTTALLTSWLENVKSMTTQPQWKPT